MLRQQGVEPLISSYERLRADVQSRDSVGQRLFRYRGLAAWLAEWCTDPGVTDRQTEPVRRNFTFGLPAVNTQELTLVVASLVQQAATGALS